MSSVGLGTGLHTFLLFLGPHIIRVAVTAGQCDSTDFDTTIEWFHGFNLLKIITYSSNSFQCKINSNSVGSSFFQILTKVEWPCLLWGIGTAIGELPPYFIARQARLSGEKLESLEEIKTDKKSFMGKMKEKIYNYVKNFGFVAIMIFASIPNPLFDLAGLTCGHFLIPFWTFFGATLIGKSIIKSNIQAIFYISIFNKSTLQIISDFIDNHIPFLQGALSSVLNSSGDFAIKSCVNKDLYPEIDSCKSCCNNMLKDKLLLEKCYSKCDIGEIVEEKSWLSSIWELFISLMILYFIISLINSTTKENVANKQHKILEKMKDNIIRDVEIGETLTNTDYTRSPPIDITPRVTLV